MKRYKNKQANSTSKKNKMKRKKDLNDFGSCEGKEVFNLDIFGGIDPKMNDIPTSEIKKNKDPNEDRKADEFSKENTEEIETYIAEILKSSDDKLTNEKTTEITSISVEPHEMSDTAKMCEDVDLKGKKDGHNFKTETFYVEKLLSDDNEVRKQSFDKRSIELEENIKEEEEAAHKRTKIEECSKKAENKTENLCENESQTLVNEIDPIQNISAEEKKEDVRIDINIASESSVASTKIERTIRNEEFENEEVIDVSQTIHADPLAIIKRYYRNEIVRDKILQLIYDTFCRQIKNVNYAQAAIVSVDIIQEIIKRGKLSDKKFIMNKKLNLSNVRNVEFCESVYTGIISPSRFVDMSNEEMKSDTLKKEENFMVESVICDMQAPKLQAETTMFTCKKCKNNKTTFYQMQTRSADEPMTNYITCCVCGNKWKFC